jgi:hypothetical protein
MSPFEYASGLISIVVGLGVARLLGALGTFIVARDRTASEWIVSGWCVVLLVNLVGWWFAFWARYRGSEEIDIMVLWFEIAATSFLFLAAFVLATRPVAPVDDTRPALPPAVFYYCLGMHFAVVVTGNLGLGLRIRESTPINEITLATLAVGAAAGAMFRSNRAQLLHLTIWAALLILMLTTEVPRIASPVS